MKRIKPRILNESYKKYNWSIQVYTHGFINVCTQNYFFNEFYFLVNSSNLQADTYQCKQYNLIFLENSYRMVVIKLIHRNNYAVVFNIQITNEG